MDLSFLERDPPDHTRLRRLVAPAFSPATEAYRHRVESTVDRLLDRAPRIRPRLPLGRAVAPSR